MNTTHTMENSSSQAQTKATVTNEISKVGIYAIAISSGIIGCWATACLVAGTISSGGPVGLISNFVKAIIG
jgi:hypothetical protein